MATKDKNKQDETQEKGTLKSVIQDESTETIVKAQVDALEPDIRAMVQAQVRQLVTAITSEEVDAQTAAQVVEVVEMKSDNPFLPRLTMVKGKLYSDGVGPIVKHGSAEHAVNLGLEKDGKTWKLVDVTQYGPLATKDYLKATLAQKINELTTVVTIDPYAKPLWEPLNADGSPQRVRGGI